MSAALIVAFWRIVRETWTEAEVRALRAPLSADPCTRMYENIEGVDL